MGNPLQQYPGQATVNLPFMYENSQLGGYMQTNTVPQIYSKMAAMLGDFDAVGKDSKNEQQGYKFRGIDALVNAAHQVLKKHGVFVTTNIVSQKSEVREVTRGNGKQGYDKVVELTVTYTFWAEDGSHVSSTIASEGLDSGDKATNKALSAALKYALIQTFQVPTEDMEDADRESPVLEGKKTSFSKPVAKADEVVAKPAQAENKPAEAALVTSTGFRRKVLNA